MNKIKLTYDDNIHVMVVPDSIVKLYNDLDNEATKNLDEFNRRLSIDPDELIINNLQIFDCLVSEQNDEDFNIINSYFMQQGKQLFGFDEDDIICEHYIPSEEDIKENIFVVCDFIEV